jgi:hypothetical protein
MALRTDVYLKDHTIGRIAREMCTEYYGQYPKQYTGLGVDEIAGVADRWNMNIYVYTPCEGDGKTYTLSSDLSSISSSRKEQLHVAYVSQDDKAHFLFTADGEKLSNSKICPVCMAQWFDVRDKKHWKGRYDKHVEKCRANAGKVKKKVKLDSTPQPFAPHIHQDASPCTDFITYDFETCEVTDAGTCSGKTEVVAQLIPISAAVCVVHRRERVLLHKRFRVVCHADDCTYV